MSKCSTYDETCRCNECELDRAELSATGKQHLIDGTLAHLMAQEAYTAREMHQLIDDVVTAARARGAKVSFFMDEIIIEEPQS